MLNERQQHILSELQSIGQVQVESLAAHFDVTTQTVRRDLSELCNRGLAARIHGGARRVVSSSMVAYEERWQSEVTAKRAIAETAARLIPSGSSVAINIGTTTEHVADALKAHKDLTVITNNINVVQVLRHAKLRALIVVGGEVRMSDGAIVGSDAMTAINRFKVDYAVIGASSLDADGSILDFDHREVAVARAILENARTRMLVCDRTKFDVSAPNRICHVAELDYLVTDKPPPARFVQAAHESKTNILIADGSNADGSDAEEL